MTSWIWATDEPLPIYSNEEKLDALLANISDSIQTQFQESSALGVKGQMKLAARFGSLLAWLGLAEASGEVAGELTKQDTRVTISSVSIYNKFRGLISYCLENEPYPCFDVEHGYRITLRRDGSPSSSSPIRPEDQIEGIGRIAGLFHLRRINPPPKRETSVLRDLLDEKPNLWIAETTAEAKIKTEIPFITTNFRSTSQAAMVVLNHPANTKIPLDGVGILSWVNGTLRCDPLVWGVIHVRSTP